MGMPELHPGARRIIRISAAGTPEIVIDHWQRLADDDPLPDLDALPVLVSTTRAERDRAVLDARPGSWGVWIPGDAEPGISGQQVGKGMSLFMAGGELGRTVGPLLATWAVTYLTLDGVVAPSRCRSTWAWGRGCTTIGRSASARCCWRASKATSPSTRVVMVPRGASPMIA
jgi:hypothetical protein